MEALRDGDPEPFEAFVRHENRSFIAFFLRLGAPRSDVEDLVQEVFVKLFRSAKSYQPRERFAAYAFRVARNAWIDRARRRASSPSGSAEGAGEGDLPALTERLPGRTEEPFTGLARREEAEHLYAALQLLPEHHRLVFELGVLQERPYAEIADLLEIPVGTVKSRMFHAVRKLREGLSGDVEGEPA